VAKRVLLIDDEQDFLDIMSAWLAFKGYAVSTAHDGLEGLDRLSSGEYDIILLDLMMPHMDGLDFCRHIRGDAQHKNIPILILTAARRVSGLKSVEEVGADAFLEKMVEHSELQAVIEKLLAESRVSGSIEDSNNTLH